MIPDMEGWVCLCPVHLSQYTVSHSISWLIIMCPFFWQNQMIVLFVQLAVCIHNICIYTYILPHNNTTPHDTIRYDTVAYSKTSTMVRNNTVWYNAPYIHTYIHTSMHTYMDTILYCTILYYLILYYITLCYIILCYVIVWYAMFFIVILYYIMSYYVKSHCL